MLLAPARALGGPPYVTDDPEPVEHRHWELYLASQTLRDDDAWSGTLPHIEANYGVVRDVQLHVITPLAFYAPDHAPLAYGYGDTELGVKIRFVQERKWVPMIGTFPLVEAPTGSSSSGLGNGSTLIFVPVWLQKSFGAWQTYGGAGVWIDLGDRDRHWWYFGWQLQRRMADWLSVGAEIFHQTPQTHGGASDTRFNVGLVFDLGEHHHVLLSAGRSIDGLIQFQSYLAYQLTFGPKKPSPQAQ